MEAKGLFVGRYSPLEVIQITQDIAQPPLGQGFIGSQRRGSAYGTKGLLGHVSQPGHIGQVGAQPMVNRL
jgi:hypothetical protein